MRSSKLKAAVAIFACIVISSALSGCSDKAANGTDKTPSVNQNQTQAQTQQTQSPTLQDKNESADTEQSGNITLDAYNEKINYYMSVVESLQSEITALKQESYIAESEYKSKIKELEATVSQLLDRIETIVAGGSITPVDPSANGSQNTDKFDNVSKKNVFEYTVDNGKAIITKYVGKDTDVEIPQVIDNYTVYAIGESAFQNCDVRNVTIPNTVRIIDWFAFAGCASLSDITIPSSVTRVEYGAFDYCPGSMQIHCEKGSYIEAYALSWGLTVVAQ